MDVRRKVLLFNLNLLSIITSNVRLLFLAFFSKKDSITYGAGTIFGKLVIIACWLIAD